MIETGGFVPASPGGTHTAARCLGCGYALEGLPARGAACPECGRPIDEFETSDPLGPVPWREAVAARSGAGLALAGLATVAFVPAVGAVVEAAGWWRLTAGPGRGRASAPILRWAIRVCTMIAALCAVAAWAAVFDVYVFKFVVTNTVADDVAVATAVTVAVVVWAVRHALACWWVGRLGRRIPEPSLVGLAAVSGAGAVAITVSGFLLIVLGGLVSHIALFPPMCFLLPVWVGVLAVWWLITGVLLSRTRRALGAVVPDNHVGGGHPAFD
ncbi:MAG: hypothetical protein AAF297_00920 [Planctomycetota bacterium]